MINTCPLCLCSRLSKVIYSDDGAIVSIGQLTDEPVPFESSPVGLKQCLGCGFVFNSAFDAQKILPIYSSTDYVVKSIITGAMSNSIEVIYEHLEPFAKNMRVLEIGCGQANLAQALGKVSTSLVTVDPSVQVHLHNLSPGSSHKHISEYFSYESTGVYGPFDLVIFRHLLEHLPAPFGFLSDVVKLTSEGGVVYIEVPDFDNVMDRRRFCDIFNDHFGYFQEASLDNVMDQLGLSLIKSTRILDGQHMGLFFKKQPREDYAPRAFRRYEPTVLNNIYEQGKQLNKILDLAGSVVVWGAGAHGESILGFLSASNRQKIKYYLDKDPNKRNKFIPGTQAQVISPGAEVLRNADTLILAAVLYENEISDELSGRFNFTGRLVKIGNGVFVERL